MKILINGQDFTKDADLSNVEISIGLNESDLTYNITSSNQLKFNNNAASWLYDYYFSDPYQGLRKKIEVSIYDDCCKKWFKFESDAKGIDYCDCEATIVLKEPSKVNKCYEFLNTKIFWRQGFAEAFNHPQIWNINRPGLMQLLVIIITDSILIIVRRLFEACKIIDKIIEALPFGIGGGGLDCTPLEKIICDTTQYITGTNWKAPAPYIKDVLEYNAAQCGLKLRSSIFQASIHRNDVLYSVQHERGLKNARNWIEDNGPNLTTIQLLQQYIKDTYNAEYRIKNGFLIVERKDYFQNAEKGILIDLSKETQCLEFITDKTFANANYTYSEDSYDKEGNRMKTSYDDRVEWNADLSEWKKGTLNVNSKLGRSRFQFDYKSYEKSGFFDMDLLFDVLAKNGILASAGICKDGSTRRSRDLILSGDKASLLKILNLEPNTDLEDAKVIRRETFKRPFSFLGINVSSVQFYDYNYPMWYKESEVEGLYQMFHYIDNPNLNNNNVVKIKDIEVELECDLVDKILNFPDDYAILTKYGPAKPKSYKINFTNKLITFEGLEVKC